MRHKKIGIAYKIFANLRLQCYNGVMTTKRLIKISYFTMLTIIGSMIRIPMGMMTLTFQSFFVVLSGLVLGKKDGAFAQTVFMILGLIGLPVFTGGGGINYVLMPSFGYIVGFIFGAYTAGLVLSRFKTLKSRHIFFAGVMGLVPIYIIGMAYQVIIFIAVNGFTVPAAFGTLLTSPLLFIKDCAMVFVVSLFYPRIMTMIGSTQKQSFKDNGLPAAGGVDSGAQIAASEDKNEHIIKTDATTPDSVLLKSNEAVTKKR